MQTILVVDDELNIRNILDFSLNAEGFNVVSASSGAEALDVAAKRKPDLIILDVMMPNGDGFSTCEKLKEDSDTKNIPVIMLTARTDREDRARATEVGADIYITKPFSPQRVVESVQSLLGVTKE